MNAKNYKRDKNWEAVPGYEMLVAVLQDAHDQAAIGKGDERHANGLPFHEQRMQQISTQLDSDKGMAFQVCKKISEGLQFDDHQRREAELLGAINYLAGIVIYHRNRQPVGAVNEAYHREDLIGKASNGGMIIGFDNDIAIIMSTNSTEAMGWYDAVNFCNSLVCESRFNWHMPSKDQLNLAWANLEKLSGLNLDCRRYWSSTQFGSNTSIAWSQRFSDGVQGNTYKSSLCSVRAVLRVDSKDLDILRPVQVEL